MLTAVALTTDDPSPRELVYGNQGLLYRSAKRIALNAQIILYTNSIMLLYSTVVLLINSIPSHEGYLHITRKCLCLPCKGGAKPVMYSYFIPTST